MLIETIPLWPDRSDVTLTAYINKPGRFENPPEKRPAVIVMPGGAFRTCSRHNNEGDSAAFSFAADGYQAFVLEYSAVQTAPEGKTLFPAQLVDYGAAVMAIRARSEQWWVDPQRITVIGFSAGGNVAGMAATSWHRSVLSDTFKVESEVFKPLCAVLIYGLVDYTEAGGMLRSQRTDSLNLPIFGTELPSPEQRALYSPACQVSEKTCPVFLAAARDDSIVPVIQTLNMAQALQKASIPYELHIFEHGEHLFGTGRSRVSPYREDMALSAAKWVPLAKTFLLHHAVPETARYDKFSISGGTV